jgi:predicted ATPase with chaperone activity
MPDTDTPTAPSMPPAPRTIEETGLNPDIVLQLVLKTLHLGGTLSGTELAKRLGVVFQVIQPSLDQLKWQQHCEIVAAGEAGAPTYKYRISDAGRARAALFLESNHYLGRLPVPLDQYRRYMLEFRNRAAVKITPENVRQAFSHLVLSDRVLDQLGPAVCAAHSLFVYGPPGNGKTVISQAIGRLLGGEIAVPHAIEIEGGIVRVFDPVNHDAMPDPSSEASTSLDRGSPDDARWVRCRRPAVMVGGELTLESLDLSYSQTTGFYHAPVQILANGGLLVIDDFGRQRCVPRDLLNRWIVPLESREDFLTLQTGQKFAVPFVVLVVFATNIKPAELVDEAFLRRIQYKVFAENPTRQDFTRIFENYCRQVDVPFDRSVVERLLEDQLHPHGIQLRGCQPRDLINQALAIGDYRGQPRVLTPALLEAACDSYFVDERDSPGVLA